LPPEPGRRRFYLFDKILTSDAAAYDWENERSCTPSGSLLGRHRHQIEGSRMSASVGLPIFTERPRFRLSPRRRLYDFYGYGPYWVSGKAKALLERIDAAAFEFEECETIDKQGRPMPSYWLMDVARLVQRFDEARSDFATYGHLDPDAPEAMGNPLIWRLNDIHMLPGFPEDWHAFRFARYGPQFIADGDIVDAWRAAGLSGAEFTPLQPPTAREMRSMGRFYNFPYWSDRLGPPRQPPAGSEPTESRAPHRPVTPWERGAWTIFALGILAGYLCPLIAGLDWSWAGFILLMTTTVLIGSRRAIDDFHRRLRADRKSRPN
jgi:Protein of unknown function (DUF1629)